MEDAVLLVLDGFFILRTSIEFFINNNDRTNYRSIRPSHKKILFVFQKFVSFAQDFDCGIFFRCFFAISVLGLEWFELTISQSTKWIRLTSLELRFEPYRMDHTILYHIIYMVSIKVYSIWSMLVILFHTIWYGSYDMNHIKPTHNP